MLLGLILAVAMDLDLRPQLPDFFHPVLRDMLGKTDHRFDPRPTGDEGDRLTVISGGKGDYSPFFFRFREAEDFIGRSPDFESPGVL